VGSNPTLSAILGLFASDEGPVVRQTFRLNYKDLRILTKWIQIFDMSFGHAYVFYPKAEDTECTAALLIDLNPIDLARGKVGSTDGGLFDYINDRPYVASSFMSTALSKVYSTAMSGRCDKRPELAALALDLEAQITMLPCRGETELVHRIFEPLGYDVSFERVVFEFAAPRTVI